MLTKKMILRVKVESVYHWYFHKNSIVFTWYSFFSSNEILSMRFMPSLPKSSKETLYEIRNNQHHRSPRKQIERIALGTFWILSSKPLTTRQYIRITNSWQRPLDPKLEALTTRQQIRRLIVYKQQLTGK